VGQDQTAGWETSSDSNASQLDFNLYQLWDLSHNLGRFRLSYTTDDRSTFADGLNSGGDVTANWTVLTGATISSTGGETFTVLGDNSILVSGNNPKNTVYSVSFSGSFSCITGIRLEALSDDSLSYGGPGRQANGNFVLTEITLEATPLPNQVPTANAGGPYLVAVGQQVTFDGSGSSDPDPDCDSLTESWTADGGTVSGSTYTAGNVPGIYDVQLIVNDGTVDSQPDTTMVVVYDPSAGFVTGGGWIDSPSGAYTPEDPNATVFDANFDSGMPTEFSGITTTDDVQGYAGLGTGSNVFGGNFLRNTSLPAAETTLTLTDLPPHTSISLGFLLATIDSWDGNGCPVVGAGPDSFNVSVDGTTIFSEVFENSNCGGQTYLPPAGVELARRLPLGFSVAAPPYGDSAYDMGLDPTFQNIPHTSSTLTIKWFASGVNWQGDTDESWAIDNVQVAIDPDITGKASFGFVAKYKKGQSTPDGNTQFQFKAGDLNFHSASYEWLVVAGANAKFKGDGTINGSGNYGFMLTATDGQVNGGGDVDTFRIKIWDKDNGDAVVYDNQMGADDDDMSAGTELGGGRIVIHTK
jgi:hypothetical protein